MNSVGLPDPLFVMFEFVCITARRDTGRTARDRVCPTCLGSEESARGSGISATATTDPENGVQFLGLAARLRQCDKVCHALCMMKDIAKVEPVTDAINRAPAVVNNRALALLIIVSALGYFVDAFDLLIFSVVRKASLAELGVSAADSLPVGLSLLNWQMAGLLIGGVLFGMIGDRRGRLTVLFGSILLYSVANLFNGFVHSIPMYKALRFCAGLGLAGELGAGVALVSEVMSAKNRGIGTMIVATCGLLGAVIASVVGTQMQWRTAFIVGGSMGLVLLILRIGVAESGLYRKMALQEVSRGNFFALFTKADRLKRYLLCIAVGLPTYFVVGLLVTGAPEFGKTLGLSETPVAGTAVLLCYLAMSVGDVVCSLLSQKLKSRRVPLFLFNAMCLIGICLYLFVPPTTLQGFYFRCALMGFGCGFWALVATNAAEQFGTNLRATVATSVPNFIRGALIPITFLFQQLKPSVGLINAAAIVGIACALCGMASAFASRETFGKDLDYSE